MVHCFGFPLLTNYISLQMPDALHCSDLKTHSNLTRSVQAVGLHLQRRPETHQLYHPELHLEHHLSHLMAMEHHLHPHLLMQVIQDFHYHQ